MCLSVLVFGSQASSYVSFPQLAVFFFVCVAPQGDHRGSRAYHQRQRFIARRQASTTCRHWPLLCCSCFAALSRSPISPVMGTATVRSRGCCSAPLRASGLHRKTSRNILQSGPEALAAMQHAFRLPMAALGLQPSLQLLDPPLPRLLPGAEWTTSCLSVSFHSCCPDSQASRS